MKTRFASFLSGIRPSPEVACAYFPDKFSRARAFICEEKLPPEITDYLSNTGYRRCGSYYYQQICQNCRLCMGYRIPLDRFSLREWQKRILRKNRDISLHASAPKPDAVKELIYLRYQYKQHYSKPAFELQREEFNAAKSLAVMYEQMYNHQGNTVELELREGNSLLAFGVLDKGAETVSAVYSVYEPDQPARSLGSLFILKSLQWAAENNYKYLHLGYWIPGHPKMHYKRRFEPAELLDPHSNSWVPVEVAEKDFAAD